MTCILELNDADLTLYRDHTVLHRSPGVGVVQGDDVRFGEEALRLSRIHPRRTNQQYFTRLNADPLPVPGTRARNHADLVYLHLKTFQPLIEAEGGEVLVAVPGILSADQLGVLLGVLQEVGVRVSGFVDAAVAALSTQPVPERAYHLDVTLQHAVVTAVDGGASVGKKSTQEVPECGLSRLLDAWINVIADRFVRETRFDPLHAAATEQQLFNQLYDWIETGARGRDLGIEIVHADHTRRVELARALFEDKTEQRLRQIDGILPAGSQVFLSARSARLPGLKRTLEALQVATTVLPPDALTRGCLDNLEQIVPADGELRLVTRLPLAAAPAEADLHSSSPSERGAGPDPVGRAPAGLTPGAHAAAASPAPAAAPAPTHALHGYDAWPLDRPHPGLPLKQDNGRLVLEASAGVLLNGSPAQPFAVLAPGDRIVVGGREFLLIHVRE